MAEPTITSKFTLTPNPGLPAQCIGCLISPDIAPEGTQFVDFGTSVDFYGGIILCQWCVIEAFRVSGYKDMQVSQLETERDRLKRQVETLQQETEKLNGAIDSLLTVRPGADPRDGLDADSLVATEEDVTDGDGELEFDVEAGEGTSDGSDESGSKRGPKNVSKPNNK